MSKGRILVADDKASDLTLIADALARRGYTVITARDGKEAVRAHARYPGEIDLLVTDVEMAPMNGSELATLLLTAQRDLRVLFVSDRVSEGVLQRTRATPPRARFLRRPFTSDELLAKVGESLHDRQPGGILNESRHARLTALKAHWSATLSKIRDIHRLIISWRHPVVRRGDLAARRN